MKEDYDIDIYEVDEGELSAAVMFEGFYLDINARVFVDEIENLWGDQVSSISMIAQFDDHLYSVEQHDENTGKKLPYVDLNLVEKAKKVLDYEVYEEIDEIQCRVNYCPTYYDLV